ncbi:MAG TPA: molecular chaperone HtpG [Gammaproteobacteria bacterium]
MPESAAAQTFGFQAEVKQLLHLVVHSLYSNREIFLRELISNASDANDRLRFESLAAPALLESSADLGIRVVVDSAARSLSVSDNGIGMSRDEIIENLGTIAHSGTARYLERLTGDQQKDSQLIGQFGVGFYSAFIIADEVEVETRKAGLGADQGVRWRSEGKGEYTVESCTRAERGTAVTLKLKPDADEFLDVERMRALIRKYSDHIAFPVLLSVAGNDREAETVNRAKALWARPRAEIGDEEYREFYKHIAHDFTDPLTWSHNRVEGKRDYTSLLYVPARAPFDLWNRESPRGLKLYVRRVFITDDASQFLPLYLRFVRGVLDTSDLDLNVSRELLQQDPAIGVIRSALTKRVLDMLEKLASDEPEKYATFWKEFGPVLKEGLAEDQAHQKKIAELLRFNTTRSDGTAHDRSLAQYVQDALAEQKFIYYLLAESATAARSSPHLEAFRDSGVEVLLLSDRLDAWAIQHLAEFGGKELKDVSRGDLELPAVIGAERLRTEASKDDKHLLKRIKRALRDRVQEVRQSSRLRESAACIVLSDQDIGHQMRELLKAAGHEAPPSVPHLEVNLGHPLLKRLAAERDDAKLERLATLVLDQAILAEGRQLDDPAGFVRRLNEILTEIGPVPPEALEDAQATER